MNTNTDNMLHMCDILPDFCLPFLLETGTEMANTTRLAYAHEINWFMDFLIDNSEYFCDKIKKSLTIDDIKHITSQDVSRYLSKCRDLGRMERTVARKRAALSSFFSYLTDNRQIPFNPVSAAVHVKVHQSDEVTYLNMDEQIKLLDSIDNGNSLNMRQQDYHDRYKKRDLALFTLLLDTGIRVSELHGIDVGDFDFDECSVIVKRKGGNFQTVYFSDDTRDLLADYLEERKSKNVDITPTDAFFVTLKGNRLSVRAIEILVKKYTKAIPGKGKKMTPHKMRSSFAMEFYTETKDILALQRKLGHKNITATNIYAKATDKKMQETRSILADKRNKKK